MSSNLSLINLSQTFWPLTNQKLQHNKAKYHYVQINYAQTIVPKARLQPDTFYKNYRVQLLQRTTTVAISEQ